ncbi:hypothetical protein JGU71_13085 [Antrihabitans sp. YC3-6]|uniref:DUF8020 domain-containing protein n=1 Tax=Antrihabitans stalagmiti TaxID=2799499 RepID=A0A934NR03_9NOCA|nr:hypothetical protein [Antrihabitans stalagmiti]MBJ8339823.1 hypothetical protein [Antrihabitans stalagmiti]
MKIRKLAAVSALTIAALGVAGGTSYAAPAPAAPAPAINYTAHADGQSSFITTDAGSLVTEDGAFKIKAADGTTVAAMPLSFSIDDVAFPIDASIEGNTAKLTPALDINRAWYHPVAGLNDAPWKTPYEREQAAFNRMKDQISIGATIGSAGGLLTGAAIGCVLGAGVAGVATAPLLALLGAGPLAGCVAGAALLGVVGGVVGALFITLPVAIASAIEYFTIVNSPFTPPAK